MFKISKILLLVASTLFVSSPVFAQDYNESLFKRDRNVSVKERPKPGYDAEGIRSGTFIVKPQLTIEPILSDNIFAAQENEESDIVIVVTPSIEAQSDFARHSLKGFADLQRREYLDFGDESVTNFGAGANGRLDVKRGTYLFGGAQYRRQHESRSAAGVITGSQEPIKYDTLNINTKAAHEFGRAKVELGLTYDDADFEDAVLAGNVIADQDFRDNNRFGVVARADYAISPDTAVFARMRYSDQNHDTLPANNITRDQNGYVIDAGANFDLSNLVRGEIGVGYLNRSFDAAEFNDVDGFSYSASFDWFATPLVTVSANGARGVEVSGLLLSPALVDTHAGLTIDYEWRRNVILSTGYEYRHEKYRGIDRTDKRNAFFVGGTYLMNRSVGLTANIARSTLNSDGAANQTDFGNTRIMFGITLKR